jgi:hypothetical protein
VIIQIETRLGIKDTARKEVDLDGEVAGDGGDYVGMERMKKSSQLTFMILILILLQENTAMITWPALHSTCDYCKGNLTILRRILHLDLAKGNPK